ncbi:MAG: histidine triad nucleotide-binding protein [Acidobacteriota bacterium]
MESDATPRPAECLFCRIAAGSLPARVVQDDEHTIAFDDINPVAPHHVVVIPRRHVGRASDLGAADVDLMGRLAATAQAVARSRGLADYRLVVNCGPGAGQTVFHLHLHLLAGRPMTWPPG